MTQDEIIRMAREAGEQEGEGTLNPIWEFTTEELERFAALVAAHEREKHLNLANEVAWSVALAEREACAKVCEKMAPRTVCAAAIRARGNE